MRWIFMFFLSLGISTGYANEASYGTYIRSIFEAPQALLNLETPSEKTLEESISIVEVSNEPGKYVEILVESPGNKQKPLLIFFHGASSSLGLRGISQTWYQHWLKKGYAVAAISLPGYGETSGLKDFCGAYTMKVVNYAVDQIKDLLGALEFGVIGFGQGSLAGALLAANRDDVRCVVCANGGYDFMRHLYPHDPLLNIIFEKDYDLDLQDIEGLKNRSLLYQTNCIQAPFFLLHRAGHPLIPIEEVSDFASAMWRAGNECLLSICPKSEDQKISYEEVLAITEKWVDEHMSGK